MILSHRCLPVCLFLAACALAAGCGPKSDSTQNPPSSQNATPASHESTNSAPAPAPRAAGVISGKITLKGTPPEEKDLPLDAQCSKLHETIPTTHFYRVGANGGLGDVFVYLKTGVTGTYPPPTKPIILDQQGCEYHPYVTAAQTGQKIVVKNSDPVLHNVHPVPAIEGNKQYNQAQLPHGPDLEFSWSNPENFLRFRCDVHPWMFSYVSIVPHPFFAVTNPDGSFSITNVPPGTYTIEAMHRKSGSQSKSITVQPGKPATADFTFDVKE